MAKTPAEQKLLESLDRLEKGGDALQNAPHDGGLATEGTNIQSRAKAKVMKALRKGGMSKEEAEQTIKAMYGGSDSSSSDSSSGSSASVAKAMDSASDSSESSGDESSEGEGESSSDDDESSEGASASVASSPKGKPFGKSHGASQLANASSQTRRRDNNLRKALVDENPNAEEAFNAAPILAKLVDAIDALANDQRRSLKKSLANKRIQKSLRRNNSEQKEFNQKVAKAFSMLFDKVGGMEDMVKAMHDQPVPNPRGSTLRKSDIREPQFGDGSTSGIDGSEMNSPLDSVPFLDVQEALTDMCLKSQGVTIDQVTLFENSKGDWSKLPTAVVQKLEQRLCAAS